MQSQDSWKAPCTAALMCVHIIGNCITESRMNLKFFRVEMKQRKEKNTVIMERLDPKGNLDEEISQVIICQFVFSFFSDRNP